MRSVLIFLVFGAFFSIAGCQSVNPTANLGEVTPQAVLTSTQQSESSPTPFPPTATIAPTMKPASSPQPTESPEPVAEAPACVRLYYEDFAQVELVSSLGERVLFDVQDPVKLSNPVTDRDVLLTTHTHFDHMNDAFLSTFPGQQLFVHEGKLSIPGVTITGIPSAHNAGDRHKPEGGTNYIYLVEMDGLRIAHFGDIGQDSFTQEQLAQLGRVDIAITQFANPYSDMNVQNRKGFNLMEQVQPKLIIPTHLNLEAATSAVIEWEGLYTELPFASICLSGLSVDTQIILMGENSRQFAERLNLSKFE